MPQPFKRRGQPVRMAPSVVAEMSAFGILIALVASHWNKIEQSLGLAYTYLLGGEEPSAFEFYHDLIDLGLREKAFLAAAKDRLPDGMIKELTEIHAEVRKLGKQRADITHGTWCSIPTRSQSLFLADVRDTNRVINQMFQFIKECTARTQSVTTRSFDLTPDKYTEWHARDFQIIMNRLVALDQKVQEFGNKILTGCGKREWRVISIHKSMCCSNRIA